ncbi:hypothetical protein DXG03_008723 [Asterophora parasitica]|uniref:Uncharacterized protein n=1 Tax=Asterophora parasitica TaxID=117018 RepID=A0A9P7GBM1_9AGAR|nr:hypothetical protein DXG03_008723 [Asterophora parasitica]
MAAFSSTATPRWASDLAGLPIILCTVIPALVHRLMRLLCVGHLAAIYVPVCAKSESNIQTIVAQSHSDQTICPSLPDAAPKSSDESCTQSPLCFIVPGYEVIYDLESFGVTASSTDGNSFTAGCSAELDANGDYVARAASACTISRDGGDLKGDAGDDVPDSIEFDVRGQAVNGEGEGSAVASLFIIDEGVDTIERVVKNDGTSDELFAVEPMIPSSSSAAGTSAPGPTYSDNILSYESTEEVLRDPSEVEQPTQTARVTPTLQEEAVSFGILHRVTCASYSLQKREFFPNASGEAFDVDLAHTMEDLSLRAPVPSGWSFGHTEENPTEPCSTSPPVADILGELAKLEDVGVVQHKEVPDLDSNDTLPFLEKMLPRRNPSRPSPRAVPSTSGKVTTYIVIDYKLFDMRESNVTISVFSCTHLVFIADRRASSVCVCSVKARTSS